MTSSPSPWTRTSPRTTTPAADRDWASSGPRWTRDEGEGARLTARRSRRSTTRSSSCTRPCTRTTTRARTTTTLTSRMTHSRGSPPRRYPRRTTPDRRRRSMTQKRRNSRRGKDDERSPRVVGSSTTVGRPTTIRMPTATVRMPMHSPGTTPRRCPNTATPASSAPRVPRRLRIIFQ